MFSKQHPSEDESVERDTSYSPASDAETLGRQQSPARSAATTDPDISEDDVQVLPGTGGPDDVGEVAVDASDIDLDEIRRDAESGI